MSDLLCLPLGPLVALGLGAMLLLVLEAACWPRRASAGTGYLALCACLLALSLGLVAGTDDTATGAAASGLSPDPYARFHVLILLVGLVTVVLISIQHRRGGRSGAGEQYPFVLLAGLGGSVLASATDLLVAAVALALGWVALAAAAGSDRPGKAATEASTKLLLAGALSTGLALYAAVLAYGATGSTDLAALFGAPDQMAAVSPALLTLASPLLAASLAIAVAVIPFHVWSADAAGGASTPIASLAGFAPRVGGVALLGRIMLAGGVEANWQDVLIILGCVSAAGGYLLALNQRSMSRLLGYAGVAHGGLCMAGMALGTSEGVSGAIVHLIAYVLAAGGSYAVLALLRRRAAGGVLLDELRGVGRRRPALAAAMALFMGSMAGMPFSAGFVARLGLLGAVMEAGRAEVALAMAAALVLAAYVHLRVIAAMLAPTGATSRCDPEPHAEGVAAVLVMALATLGLGIWPAMVVDAAQAAVAAL